jgi:hypothetical protein
VVEAIVSDAEGADLVATAVLDEWIPWIGRELSTP